MHKFKDDYTLKHNMEDEYFYIKGNENYRIYEDKPLAIVKVENDNSNKSIIFKMRNKTEFINELEEKNINIFPGKEGDTYDEIIAYDSLSNQRLKELIDALSSKESLAIEVMKEDNKDFGRLVRTASEYHLANQMNYTKAMKETKNIFKTIKLADFVVSSGGKVIKGVASKGLKKGIEGEGKEVLIAYVKKEMKKKGKKIPKAVGMLVCTTYFISDMEEYISKSEEYLKKISSLAKDAEEGFKTLFWHLLEEDYLEEFIKKNREEFKKGWLNKRITDKNYLSSILKIVTINGLLEESFDQIEEFLGRSFEQHIIHYLKWSEFRELIELSEKIEQVVNPFNYTETIKNLAVKKISEFFSVWNIALIELMGKESKYIGQPVEVLVNDYLELVKKYQNVSKLSQIIIKIGVIVRETALAVSSGIAAGVAMKSLWEFIFGPVGMAKKIAITGGTFAFGFYIIKVLGEFMIMYASTIAEKIYLDGENINSLIPLFEYFASEMDIDCFNINTNSLETLRIDKEWPEKIGNLIENMLSTNNFNLEVGNINNLNPRLVRLMTTTGIFEEYYLKKNLDKDIERLTLYFTDKEEEIKENIKDLFYYADEEEHQEDLLEYEKLVNEKMEEAIAKFPEEKMKKITNLVTNQSTTTWYGKEEFEEINKEIFENVYKENMFYITYGKDEGRFEITNLFIDNIEEKSPFKILGELYNKSPLFYKKYVERLVNSYEKDMNDFSTMYIRDKHKEEEYLLRTIGSVKKYIEENNNIKIFRNKDIFLYSEYSYYIDKNLVGGIRVKNDYDYILIKYSDTRELLLLANSDFRDLFLNLRGSVGIDNSQLVHQEVLNEIDVEYKEKTSGDDRELDQLRGYGILKWKGKRLGENLEFAYDDNKNFWERGQEYSFEVFKDSEGLLYFYNRRNNFLKIKKIEDDKEDILVTIRDFNNCDYGIEIPKKIIIRNIEQLSVGGAKVIETHYYETATYGE